MDQKVRSIELQGFTDFPKLRLIYLWGSSVSLKGPLVNPLGWSDLTSRFFSPNSRPLTWQIAGGDSLFCGRGDFAG
jgi:hypothetical protein